MFNSNKPNKKNGTLKLSGSLILSDFGQSLPEISLGRRRLAADSPAFIVAEIGLNHCGSMDRALQLIEAAADSGADGVKFQKRSPSALLSRPAYNRPYNNGGNSFGPTYGKHRAALEFNLEQYQVFKSAAEQRGLEFFASVWDQPSLEDMDLLGIPVFKIGSPDLTNEPLMDKAAQLGKPLFVSTGMCQTQEIDHAVELLKKRFCPLVLFHCVSLYPTPAELAKLSTLRAFSVRYNVPIGYSGHELDISVAIAARALGACVIEKHFTVDRNWKGGDQKTSLTPDEFSDMVRQIRTVEMALSGVRSELVDGERFQREKLGKSIVATRDLAPGETLTEQMVTCKCPGGGVSPQNLPMLLGRRLRKAVKAEEYILMGDVDFSEKTIDPEDSCIQI